jgi:hypothetical protein
VSVRTRILNAALARLAEGGAQDLTRPRIRKAAGMRQASLQLTRDNEEARQEARRILERTVEFLQREE